MAQVKRTGRTAHLSAATDARNFRTFLLMAQFEAREIGARITQARNEKGLTQEEVAEMASFSKRSLQDYEAGETIPYRHFRELGRLLGRPTEWFLYGANGDVPDLQELRDEALTRHQEIVGRLDLIEAQLRRIAVATGAEAV